MNHISKKELQLFGPVTDFLLIFTGNVKQPAMTRVRIAPLMVLILLCIQLQFPVRASAQPEGRVSLNAGWKFAMPLECRDARHPEIFASAGYDDSEWRSLDLPHDWGVEHTFRQEYPGETGKLPWWGRAWYRKHLTVSDLSKEYLLGIDGAMSGAIVYCNGVEVAKRPYGYSSFEADLSPALHEGDNVIAISLDNPEESSRWYPGGGIYRNVWLTESSRIGVETWGVFVTTPVVGAEEATVSVAVTLKNHSHHFRATHLVNEILYNGEVVCRDSVLLSWVWSGQVVRSEMKVAAPKLWTPGSPSLYSLKTSVKAVYEDYSYSCSTTFGIRSAEWRPDGFYLNGEKTFLKGVCLHHDAGSLGAVWNDQVWKRRLGQMKEMGCNAIRCSHNPPAPEFLDLCDEMGFLVIDEFTDTWTMSKKTNGYATLFREWADRDLVDMIKRDRNHPSVIAWSIGNEVAEQGMREKWYIARHLSAVCHTIDPTRPTTAGNDNLWAASQPYASTIDVYGFNYKPHAYKEFRDAHPDQPFFGSETASCISTRGYYLFPVSDEKNGGWTDDPPFQVSSYDLYAPAWASSPDYEWSYEDEVPECAGEFVWTGFDYLGEPTPYNLDISVLSNFHTEEEKKAYREQLMKWGQKVLDVPLPSRSSYFGIIDLAGFPKDRFWLYQARWRPDLPMVHIVPHWTWPDRKGLVTPIHVYTSGDEAELFVNGKSMGRKARGEREYRLRWDDVVYKKGAVEVVAYKDGKEWAREKISTAGKPRRLKISADKDQGGEGDLSFVTVRITDWKGRLAPHACNDLEFSVSGNGEILAADSGDPTSLIPFRTKTAPAFNGLCAVVIRRTGPGPIKVSVKSKGLRRGRVVVS